MFGSCVCLSRLTLGCLWSWRSAKVQSGVSSQSIVCSVNIGHVGSGFNHFRRVCHVLSPLSTCAGQFWWSAALVPRSCAGSPQVDSGVSSQWIVCFANIGHVGSGFNHFHHVN